MLWPCLCMHSSCGLHGGGLACSTVTISYIHTHTHTGCRPARVKHITMLQNSGGEKEAPRLGLALYFLYIHCLSRRRHIYGSMWKVCRNCCPMTCFICSQAELEGSRKLIGCYCHVTSCDGTVTTALMHTWTILFLFVSMHNVVRLST